MSSKDNTGEGTAPLEEVEVERIVRRIDTSADELAELLDLLEVLRATAEELAPEVRTAVAENRRPLRDLRLAFEREETVVLLQRLGNRSEELVELLDTLEAVEGLLEDLTPQIRLALSENRDVLRRVRSALEREETLILVERLGENADALAETLELLGVTRELAEDLLPGLTEATVENRDAIRQLRMVAEGFADSQADADLDPYELGQNLGNTLRLADRVGQPDVVDSLDAGLSAFSAEAEPKPVGLFGLLGALRDEDVKRGLGRILEALRRIGRSS